MAAVISPESEIGVDSPSPSSRAAQHLAHDRFHRRFALPATDDHGELQVSYADVGCTPEHPGHASQKCPTILFIPGMFASRYLSVSMHTIAEKLGVRVLMVDRYVGALSQLWQPRGSRWTNALVSLSLGLGWVIQQMCRFISDSMSGSNWCLAFWSICRSNMSL